MPKSTTKQSDEKQYSLSNIDINFMNNAKLRYDQSLLDFFSFLCIERLGITVTENTEFRTDDSGHLYVKERAVDAEVVS